MVVAGLVVFLGGCFVVRKTIPIARITIIVGADDLPFLNSLAVIPYDESYAFGLILVSHHITIINTVDLVVETLTDIPVVAIALLRLLLFPFDVFIQNTLNLRYYQRIRRNGWYMLRRFLLGVYIETVKVNTLLSKITFNQTSSVGLFFVRILFISGKFQNGPT